MQTFVTKTRQLIDRNTGEYFDLDEIFKIAYNTKQFWKLYLSDFLPLLGIIVDNKQIDVLIYVLENTNPSNNIFIGSFRNIAQKAEISLSTVYRIMTRLQTTIYKKEPMLKKLQNGVYMVSPNLLMKGNDIKRKSLLVTWQQLGKKTIEDYITEEEEKKEKPELELAGV